MSDAWRPSGEVATLRQRAAMLARVRDHFRSTGALEAETPLLSAAAVSDVHIESASARLCGLERHLHTSPEYAMKRLLAAGFGDCYQICRVFRDGERGRLHHPEFTLIEWYRVGFELEQLMREVERVVVTAIGPLRRLGPATWTSYQAAVVAHAGVDPLSAPDAELRAALTRHGVDCPAGVDARDDLLDLIVATLVGPRLGHDGPCFVTAYPASQAALARLDPADPRVAQRFELYLDGVELANGFHELADADEQRRRFESDQRQRIARGLPVRPTDEHLLAALAHGLPDCCGVALGFDRLVLCATGAGALNDVVAFPFARA